MVADFTYLFENKEASLEQIFWREVENCVAVKRRIEGSQCVDIFRTQKEFTYRSNCLSGEGWVLVGDAFGFLDPIYSSGLQLAFSSGTFAG